MEWKTDIYGHGLPRWFSDKESTCQCRRCKRISFDPWVRKIRRRRNGNPLQYSCLENPMDKGAWQTTVHGVAKSDTTELLTTHTHTYMVTDILSSWHTSPDSLVGRESNTTKKRKLLLSLTKIHFIRETTVSHTGVYELGGRNSFLLMWQSQGGIIWAGN